MVLRQIRAEAFMSTQREGVVVIEVRDTGPGIPADDMQKIFIPFFTTKAKGHGIGLALTHRIITQHGGTLTAANSPEGGAVFTIVLATDERGLKIAIENPYYLR